MRPFGVRVFRGVNLWGPPVVTAVGPRKEARGNVRGKGVGLHWLITVAVLPAVVCMGWHLGGAVKTDHAAIERILADEIHGVLRQIYRKVRRIVVTETVVEVLEPRRPPLDVDVCEVDATAAL